MRELPTVTLSFQRPARLPARVTGELHRIGVDAPRLKARNGSVVPKRAESGQLVLEIVLYDFTYGLTDLQPVLATLGMERISYTASDSEGMGQSYDAATDRVQSFSADG